MSLIDYKMLKYLPSMIACASIYLILKIRKNSINMMPIDQFVCKTGYSEEEFCPCARDLCDLI